MGTIQYNIGFSSARYLPVLAASSSAKFGKHNTGFTPSSSLSQRAIISGLWGATRQFVHERSGLPPPLLLPSTSAPVPSNNLHSLLAQRASSLIPTAFRPQHLPLSSVPFSPTRCTFAHILFQTLTLEHEGHPHFHGPAPVSAIRLLSLNFFASNTPFLGSLIVPSPSSRAPVGPYMVILLPSHLSPNTALSTLGIHPRVSLTLFCSLTVVPFENSS